MQTEKNNYRWIVEAGERMNTNSKNTFEVFWPFNLLGVGSSFLFLPWKHRGSNSVIRFASDTFHPLGHPTHPFMCYFILCGGGKVRGQLLRVLFLPSSMWVMRTDQAVRLALSALANGAIQIALKNYFNLKLTFNEE